MNNELLLTIGIIVFVLFLLNAIFLTVIFFIRKRMVTVSQWPSTMGMVTMSQVETRSTSDGYTDYPFVQ